MANATVFLCSTCYDLSIVRSELTEFLNSYRIDVLNSEKSSFGVTPGMHSHTACLEQVRKADILLMIIGGRRGGTYIGSEQSITSEEYNVAAKLGMPRILCVQRNVLDTMPLWKKNPTIDVSGVVDDVRIFDFVDYIRAEATDNWIFPFETIEEIKVTVLEQFAHYLHVFSQSQRVSLQKQKAVDFSKLTYVEFPSNTEALGEELELEARTILMNGLRVVHSTLRSILTSSMKNDVKRENLKALWVIASRGDLVIDVFEIDNDVFKAYAWSTSRGRRVFKQLEQFNVVGEYESDEDSQTLGIRMSFKVEEDDIPVSWSLKYYIDALIKKFGEDAFERFCKADMRLFMSGVGD